MQSTLSIASETDIEELLPMVARYHETERIASSQEQRTRALLVLLREPKFGLVWLIRCGGMPVGYIVVCFCYSIEFGGHDSFIDEFFIEKDHRGLGLGSNAIVRIMSELSRQGIRALSLEVSKINQQAMDFYLRCGFETRDCYSIMTRHL